MTKRVIFRVIIMAIGFAAALFIYRYLFVSGEPSEPPGVEAFGFRPSDGAPVDDKVEIPIREVPPDHQIPAEVLNYISRNSVTHYQFVPLGLKDGVLEVGMLDPGNL